MAAEAIVIPIPVAYPAILFEGTWESVQEVIEWLKGHDNAPSRYEFMVNLETQSSRLTLVFRGSRSDLNVYDDWWIIKGKDSYWVAPVDGIHNRHTLHMTTPKEVPVVAGE